MQLLSLHFQKQSPFQCNYLRHTYCHTKLENFNTSLQYKNKEIKAKYFNEDKGLFTYTYSNPKNIDVYLFIEKAA